MRKVFVAVIALTCAAAVVSCGSKNTVTKGNPFSMDSLSYCLGANIGFGIAAEMKDIEFDFAKIEKGMEEGALEKSKQTQDEAVEILRNYFMNKLQERKGKNDAIKADSTSTEELVPLFASKEECDSVSYAFGNDIGNNVRSSKLPLQTRWLIKGFDEARQDQCKLTEEEIQQYLQNYFTVVRPAQLLKKAQKWLAKMEKKSGVKKTESGLLYKVVKEGDMTLAATSDEDTVKVNYEGKTSEGVVFDSSYERGEPIEFRLDRVIKGWTEGMKLVGVGGEIILYIPSELAYGQRGAGRDIGPNEALEFKVELLEVTPAVKEEVPAEETPAQAE